MNWKRQTKTQKKLWMSVGAAVFLSACMMVDPAEYLVGQRGGKNIYEFEAIRFVGINADNAYKTQRDRTASQLCPQGYEYLSERVSTGVFVSGPSEMPMMLVRIACPI